VEGACDLSRNMVCDTTFRDTDKISNELRHMYWFGEYLVNAGDWVKLMTGIGQPSVGKNDRGTKTHTFFWNLGRTVWNQDGDCAVLFQLNDWRTTLA
jgi:hypothetical protein